MRQMCTVGSAPGAGTAAARQRGIAALGGGGTDAAQRRWVPGRAVASDAERRAPDARAEADGGAHGGASLEPVSPLRGRAVGRARAAGVHIP